MATDIYDLIVNPISNKNLRLILLNDKKLQEFISLYDYFGTDGNNNLYKSYINELLLKKELSNLQINNLFNLIIELDYFNSKVINYAEFALSKRINYLTKLNVLLFLLNHKKRITNKKFIDLNKFINTRTKNSVLKIVSSYNLLLSEKKQIIDVVNPLKKAEHPTLYYLLVNCMKNKSSNNYNQKELVNSLISMIVESKFSNEVRHELIYDLKNINVRKRLNDK